MMRKKSIISLIGALSFSALIVSTLGVATSCSSFTDNALVVDSAPIKTTYKVGEALELEGLSVVSKKVVNGYLSADSTEVITDYKISFEEGYVFEKEGTFTINITKGGYKDASFDVVVGDEIVTKKLAITSYPSKVAYKVGNSFSTTGLNVREIIMKGEEEFSSTVSTKYTTNPEKGTKLTEEGSFLVEVSKEGFASAFFTISVTVSNQNVYNLFSTLRSSKNYTMEIYNTVGTTVNTYGFHYKEIFAENYFEKITYNKTAAEEAVGDRGRKIDSDIGYVNFDGYNDTVNNRNYAQGVYQVNLATDSGEIEASKPMSSQANWWNANLTDTFANFSLSDVPTNTINGKFSYEVILDPTEKKNNAGAEDDDWSKSIANNPFAISFLNMCGWSSSLIEIMSRIDIELNKVVTDNSGSVVGRYDLYMKAYLGSYGYTTLTVNNIGTTSSDSLDTYMEKADRCYDTSIDKVISDGFLQSAVNANNYTLDLLSLSMKDGTNINVGKTFFTDDGLFVEYDDSMRDWIYANSEEGKKFYIPNIGYIATDKSKTINTFDDDGNVIVDGDKNPVTTTISGGVGYVAPANKGDKGYEYALNDMYVSQIKVKDTAGTETNVTRDNFFDLSYTDDMQNQIFGTSISYTYLSSIFSSLLSTDYDKGDKGFTWYKDANYSTTISPFIISRDNTVKNTITDMFNNYFSSFLSTAISASAFDMIAVVPVLANSGDTSVVKSMTVWLLRNDLSGYNMSFYNFGSTLTPSYVTDYLKTFTA